jgi:hypothetical protein
LVLDIDSKELHDFDAIDALYLEKIAERYGAICMRNFVRAMLLFCSGLSIWDVPTR